MRNRHVTFLPSLVTLVPFLRKILKYKKKISFNHFCSLNFKYELTFITQSKILLKLALTTNQSIFYNIMATSLEFPERTISSVNTLSKANYGCKTILAMWVVQLLNIACLRISQQISYNVHFLYLFRIFPETMKHIPSSTLRGGLSKVENFSSLCLVIMNHHKPTPVKINSNV